jgi:L-threonylcarbamoyladenylate synthase
LVTDVLRINPSGIEPEIIKGAAEVIRSGGLVAFPTETVYGLGANAYDEKAVIKIFEAKGRPQDNPLIVHVSSVEQVKDCVRSINETARLLIKEFWPGPLTLVMEKSDKIPYRITAGLDTVAVRMPSHPVATELIKCSGVPIVAPSANTSGKPSTTNAQHVIEDLSGKIDMILDAGSSEYGLESTVLDTTTETPTVLRPGGTTIEAIKKILGNVIYDTCLLKDGTAPRSPGMKYRHYAPKAEMYIVIGEVENIVEKIKQLESGYKSRGIFVGILATDQTMHKYAGSCAVSAGDRSKPDTIAANLFGLLRKFDKMGVQVILAEAISTDGLGLAVMNRLEKAAGYKVIMA